MKQFFCLLGLTSFLTLQLPGMQSRQSSARAVHDWAIHDVNRPQPPVVSPGSGSTPSQPGKVPSDATVLFDGRSLSNWEADSGGPARWKVQDGYMEVVKGSGNIVSKNKFADCQLHVEWRTPVPAVGEGQERGNSGIFLMGKYEIQVLDSYQSKTYPDGQAAAVYGQYPPLVNASLPPGEWQTYDIIFRRPIFDSSTKQLRRPARVTVLHNGILVQDNVELTGPTAHGERPAYQFHADRLPLSLQDHGNPVRYRNIWIRELPESE